MKKTLLIVSSFSLLALLLTGCMTKDAEDSLLDDVVVEDDVTLELEIVDDAQETWDLEVDTTVESESWVMVDDIEDMDEDMLEEDMD